MQDERPPSAPEARREAPAVQATALPRKSIVAGSLTLAGGLMAILGAALTWGKVSVGPRLGARSISAAGTNGVHGKVVLSLGIVMALAGMATALAARRDFATVVAAIALAAGLSVTALTVYNIATKNQQFVRGFRRGFEQVTGRRLTDQEVRTLARQFGIRLTFGPGLFVALAGGVVGAIGGVVGVATIDRVAPPPSEPGPGSPEHGSASTEDGPVSPEAGAPPTELGPAPETGRGEPLPPEAPSG